MVAPAPDTAPASRLPALVMGAVAVFAIVHLINSVLFPQQVYPEWEPRQNLLACVLAALALASAAAGRLPLRPLLLPGGLLVAVEAWSWQSTLGGPFPFAGTSWLATQAQVVAFFVVGYALTAHARAAAADGRAEFVPAGQGRAVLWFAALVALFYVADALDQHLRRFPVMLGGLLDGSRAGEFAAITGESPGGEMARRMAHAVATGRVSSRLGNPNLLAAVLCVLWPAVAALAATARRRTVQIGVGALAFVAVPAVLWLTGSRGGVLTFGGAVVVTAFVLRAAITKQRVAFVLLAFALGGLLGIALAATAPVRRLASTPAYARFIEPPATLAAAGPGADAPSPAPAPAADAGPERFTRPSTVQQRLGFLRTAVAMAANAGIWGSGAGGFEYLFAQYQEPGQQETQFAHCWPLQVAIETGWPGLVLVVVLFAVLLWGLYPRGRVGGEPPTPAAALRAVAFVAVLVFVANGLVEISFYHREIALLAWLFGGIGWGMRDAAPTRPTVRPTARRAVAVITLGALLVVAHGGATWMCGRRLGALRLADEAGLLLATAAEPALARGDIAAAATALARAERLARGAADRFPRSPIPQLKLAALGPAASRLRRAAASLPPEAAAVVQRLEPEPEDSLLRASNLHPTSASIRLLLAGALIDRAATGPPSEGLLARAAEEIERAQRLAPRQARTHRDAATLWMRLGRPEKATEAARLADTYDHEAIERRAREATAAP